MVNPLDYLRYPCEPTEDYTFRGLATSMRSFPTRDDSPAALSTSKDAVPLVASMILAGTTASRHGTSFGTSPGGLLQTIPRFHALLCPHVANGLFPVYLECTRM